MPWRLGGKGKRSAAPTRREDPGETHAVNVQGKPRANTPKEAEVAPSLSKRGKTSLPK